MMLDSLCSGICDRNLPKFEGVLDLLVMEMTFGRFINCSFWLILAQLLEISPYSI